MRTHASLIPARFHLASGPIRPSTHQRRHVHKSVRAAPSDSDVTPDASRNAFAAIPTKTKVVVSACTAYANPGSHFRPWHCPCCNPQVPSHSTSPREHTFWSCPVALHLRNAITSAMGPQQAPLSRASFWLLLPPHTPGLNRQTWLAVCAAFFDALDYTRRKAWACHHSTSPPVHPPHLPTIAVARFWAVLADIADACPADLKPLPPTSPFFRNHPTDVSTVVVRLPVMFPVPN